MGDLIDVIAKERENWKVRQRALERARQRLANEGISYPVWDSNISYEAFYEKVRAYSQKESTYMLGAIREEAKPEQIKNPENKRRTWEPYNE